ncbi:MAG: hypothetical protein U0Q15_16935 [Kineosporiaceae bacterium]
MTHRSRLTGVVVSVAVTLMVLAAPGEASASPVSGFSAAEKHSTKTSPKKHRRADTTFDDGMADVLGEESSEDSTENDRIADPHAPGHFRRRATLPKCPGNTMLRQGADAMCADASEQCRSVGQQGMYAVWTFVGPRDVAEPAPDKWTVTGWRCVREREQNEAAPVPVLDERQFRRLPIPAGVAHVQPSGRPVLVNMDTNVYVDADDVLLRTTVLGRAVEVAAKPTRFVWTFGDGQSLTTTDPGGPYPRMTTTHVYTRTGRQVISLTTVYTGRFRVVGETEWLPVEGTAEVASPGIGIEVIEARAVLVP